MKFREFFLLLAALSTVFSAVPVFAGKIVILSTTTSTQDSGLLDVLLPAFQKETGYFVKTIAVGSGQAMKMGEKGEADVLLVHSPVAEEKFVDDGYGINRNLVMHNDFVILGPPDDPAGIRGDKTVTEALRKISSAGSLFLSRGDNSGTHVLEKKLWKSAGLGVEGRDWYQQAGLGMGQTLNTASERGCYAISDRGTYLSLRKSLNLEILVQGDAPLLNLYHVIQVNPERWPRVNGPGARAFADFLLSDKAQALIRTFGKQKFGFPLFFADAGKHDVSNSLLASSHDDSSPAGKNRPPDAPAVLSVALEFSEPSGNRILDGEETGFLILTVTNSGKGDASGVVAELGLEKDIPGLSFDTRVTLGRIPVGGKVSEKIPLRAAETVSSADARFKISVKEENGFDADPVSIALKVKAFEAPNLLVADVGIEDQNGNARIEPMEMVELTARIQNIGHGDARSVSVEVVNGENVFLAGDGVGHFDLGTIPAGKFRDMKFMFYSNKRIGHGEKIPITVKINEAHPRFRVAKALDLVMNSGQKRTQEIIVKGEESGRKSEIQLAGGLSVDVDENIPAGVKAGKYDVAVIIGNRSYAASGAHDVEYAQRDARIMKEYLIRALGYDEENIIYAEDAGLSKFNEIFGSERDFRSGRLHKYVREGVSQVFIYYVGHGAPDLETGEAYFVPVDANPQYIKANGYRLQTFYANLSRIPAKKMTIVLDACFSGNTEKGMLFKNISPALVKVKKELQGPKNAVVITSAAVDQVSTWYPEKRHSLFTYYFLKGLQGDADLRKDGKITVGEMEKYLKDNVPYMARRLAGTEQHPVINGNGSDVIAVFKQ